MIDEIVLTFTPGTTKDEAQDAALVMQRENKTARVIFVFNGRRFEFVTREL